MASATPAWMEGFEEEEEWVSEGSSLSASSSPATATATSIPNWAGSSSISYATPRKQPQSHSKNSMLQDEREDSGEEREEERQESPMGGGTFLIRDDQPLPDTPLGLKPGQMQLKRGGAKTIFSPLPLERLFDPPSPPTTRSPTTNQAQASPRSTTPPLPPPKPVFPVATATSGPKRSKLSQSHLPPPSSPEILKDSARGNVDGDSIEASDIPGLVGFDGRKQSSTFQFTFIVPRTPIPLRVDTSVSRTHVSPANPSPNPRANDTPKSIWRYDGEEQEDSIFSEEQETDKEEPTATGEQEQEQDGTQMADARLKLFRLQYDTYTRDHLGALADSIAVKASSPQHEGSSVDEEPVWRSTKRIKLSPRDDITSSDQSFRTSSSGDFHQSPWGKVQTRSFFNGTTNSMIPPKILEDDGRSPFGKIDSQGTSVSFEEVLCLDQSPLKIPDAPNNGRERRHASGSSTTTVTEPAINTLPQTIAKRAAVNYRLQGANILAQIKKDVDLAMSDGPHSIVVEEQSFADSLSRSSADASKDLLRKSQSQPGHMKEEDLRLSKSGTSRSKRATPRKLLRRISAADEVDKEVLFSGNNSLVESPAPASRKRSPDTRDSPVKPVKPVDDISFKVPPTIVLNSAIPLTNAMPLTSNPPATSNTPPMLPSRQPSTAPMTLHPNHHVLASHDDMNRFVSSSTLASGISGTTAGSFVKHAGPPNLRTIRPEELHGVIGAKVGGMTYSKERQMWVKLKEVEGDGEGDAGTTSDDPFGDIESLEATPRSTRFLRSMNGGGGGGDSGETQLERSFVVNPVPQRPLRDEDVIQNEEDIVTEEEGDGCPAPPPPQINPDLQFDSDFTASTNPDEQIEAIQADQHEDSVSGVSPPQQLDEVQDTSAGPIARSLEELSEGIANISLQMDMSPPRPARPTKIRTSFDAATTPNAIRTTPSSSASSSRPQIFPRSVLKQPTPQKPITPRRYTDPVDFSSRRSVSFSDGRKAGKIRGLASPSGETEDTVTMTEPSYSAEVEEEDEGTQDQGASSYIPSARTKRIGNLLEGLEGSEDGSGTFNTFITRSKEGSRGQSSPQNIADPAQPLSARSTEEHQKYHDFPEQEQDQNQPQDESTGNGRRFKRTEAGHRADDATFLTEASFRVTHDQLIRVLTLVQPYEPYWEELRSVHMNRKGLNSLTRLKEFLPSLERLSVEENHLTWLSGVPSTLRALFAANNLFTSVTSYTHLPNLEELDISHGQVESLQQLECLRHLRELKVDGNCVTRLDGITQLDGLVKVSIQGNALGGVLDLYGVRWPRMETLDLSENRLTDVRGISRLKALISLNLDNNELEAFNTPSGSANTSSSTSPVTVNSRLRVLRLSGNRLAHLELGSDASVSSLSSPSWCAFPGLRTFYADGNRLGEVVGLEGLTRLENLSLREQRRSDGIVLSGRSIRDIKRLYLSGNALPAHLFISSSPLYNLVYLELASCRLTSLPQNLAACVPNLRVLNLNYNFLSGEDIVRGLTTPPSGGGLRRLRKLTMVGGRVKSWRGVVGKLLRGLGELEVLDFRMNPFSLGWYFPLLVNASDLLSAVQPTSHLSTPAPQQSETSPSSSPTRDSASQKSRRKSPYAPTWMELDERFRRDLPDAVYMERLAYRGLVMRACGSGGPGGKLNMLDGVEVTDGEREKAGKLLSGLEKAAAARAQAAAGSSSSPMKDKGNRGKA
ncbi:hypothetical protein FRB97_005253 [Tulasnella sp. 331]|nr:hypothetical protein FRB97_005253 [Tulasnella sp. 331]